MRNHFHAEWWLKRPGYAHQQVPNTHPPLFPETLSQLATQHEMLPLHQQRLLEGEVAMLSQDWSGGTSVLNPIVVRTRGRPQGAIAASSIRRDPSEFEIVEMQSARRKRKCRECDQEGHDRRTCPRLRVVQ